MSRLPAPNPATDMTQAQVRELLAVACAIDNRQPSQAALLAWQMALRGLALQECADALAAHIAERPGVWCEPGHIRERVLLARRPKVERKHQQRLHDELPPLNYERSHAAYLAASQALAAARATLVPSPQK